MIQTLIVIAWTVPATIFFAILAILISLVDPTGKGPHQVARTWAKSILIAGRIKVKVKGLSKIDPTTSCIYMCNHQSNFDIPVLLAYLKVQFRWLAKAELFRIPLFGFAMRRAGYISIDRTDRQAAFTSLKKAAKTIREGASVIIFPEGTRSPDGNISPFKKGGFVLALDSGIPIVPVILHGTRSIMPKKQLRIVPGTVVVEITEPIDISGYTKKNKEALMDRIRNIICEAFEKNRTEIT
jgi:1-acyl-sn-glycerol-3-phosphate acyltransferase